MARQTKAELESRIIDLEYKCEAMRGSRDEFDRIAGKLLAENVEMERKLKETEVAKTKAQLEQENAELRNENKNLKADLDFACAELDAEGKESGPGALIDELRQSVLNRDTLIGDLEARIKELEQTMTELAADKAQHQDSNYLRRELAYTQGQLHQSHSTVKQLCAGLKGLDRRPEMFGNSFWPPDATATHKAFLGDTDLNGIKQLSEQVREMMALLVNWRDAEAICRAIVGTSGNRGDTA